MAVADTLVSTRRQDVDLALVAAMREIQLELHEEAVLDDPLEDLARLAPTT